MRPPLLDPHVGGTADIFNSVANLLGEPMACSVVPPSISTSIGDAATVVDGGGYLAAVVEADAQS